MKYKKIVPRDLLAIFCCMSLGIISLPLSCKKIANENRMPSVILIPAYPELARRMGMEGRVQCDAEISEEGRIQNIINITGGNLLVGSTKRALQGWIYPRGAKHTYRINIVFHLVDIDVAINTYAEVMMPNEVHVYAHREPPMVSE
jgi:hypothetical protein